jgi:hypothetical protein
MSSGKYLNLLQIPTLHQPRSDMFFQVTFKEWVCAESVNFLRVKPQL